MYAGKVGVNLQFYGFQATNTTNLAGEALGYSAYGYDVEGATVNDVVYPSLDPMIFEVKNLNEDIKGRVVPL